MKLYIDDRRPTPEGWEGTASISKAIYLLSTGFVEEISLDYDCGREDESYATIAYYIALMPESFKPKINIHTDNPAGRKLMEDILKGETI